MSFFETEIDNTKNTHFIWVEKYRPTNLKDYLGNDDIKTKASKWIESKEIPHLLFHSRKPGTGKTTIAKMLTRNIPCDELYINASKENRIDDVRTKINSFAGSLGFNKLKICILDECDAISPEGQKALRNVMESYAKNCRFILTCNYVEKLLEPLVSRCQVFHLQPPDRATVAKHVAKILDTEGVTYNPQDFKILLKYYPDVRRIIQCAQQNSVNGKLEISENQVIESDSKIKMLEIIKSKKSQEDRCNAIRQLLADTPQSDYQEYYDYLYETIDDYAQKSIATVITTLADWQFKETFVANKEINFAACISQILKSI